MIVTCPNCIKRFKIDTSQIPEDGRNLQCGACNYVWFHEIDNENSELLKLNEEVFSDNVSSKIDKREKKENEKKQSLEKINNKINKEKKEEILENQNDINATKNIKNKGTNYFSYLIVFIISFVALIILIDTLKTPLIDVFPELEIILFNLFETLKDIKLFIIDLS